MIEVVRQRPMDAMAVPPVKVFFGIRVAGDEPAITSGSLRDLPVGDPGTATWWSGIPTAPHLRGAPADYSLSETYTESARETFAEVTTDTVQADYEMAQLEAAAQAGDERAFVAAQRRINWQRRSPEDFIRAIQLALSSGAHLAARNLSASGAARFPDREDLQKYARVLAPPRVIRTKLPANPAVKANRDWLVNHSDAYHGQWVALRNGELVGSAKTLKVLSDQLGDTKGLLLTKVY